jgi:aromatic ring-cleaving dioxygenase
MAVNPKDVIKFYHAHVYFDAGTTEPARELRSVIEANFEIQMGRFHEKPVGPHPKWSYQVAFGLELFGSLVPWLSVNRRSLTVFVHACTGDHIMDHTEYACWLGESVPLDLDALR